MTSIFCTRFKVENDQRELNFLRIKTTNTNNYDYDFKVHCKEAITNIQIKSDSNINPAIINGFFKGFISQAIKICSEKYINKPIQFIIDMFVENGHKRTNLETIVANYLSSKNNPNNKITKKLENNVAIIKLPWLPTLGPKLRKALKTYNVKVIFTTSPNLNTILCNNKSRFMPNSNPGVYKLMCSCGRIYIGETKKRILQRSIEHQINCMNGNWHASEECHGIFDWLHLKILSINSSYHERKIKESLEMN
ncbi:uncharacterized protein LOC136090971 [Hydra vulgaris]|uniref:Uncharacterized protein LOC136090971 n=1 Tax=Hydra vulgaris TaxID=6087 RepID=A0ABM4DHQ6_HYDVU